jgi:transposase-like protein
LQWPGDGVNPNQVFGWRKQYHEGSLAAVKAGETVVPASELAAAIKEIKELQWLLGKRRWRTRFFARQSSGAGQKP